jgi:hypothetical protein
VLLVLLLRRARGGGALEQPGVGQHVAAHEVVDELLRLLVARVVHRHHRVAVSDLGVSAKLEQHLGRPVVTARRGGHERRDVPAPRVDLRPRLDEHAHHLAVAGRLIHHRQLQRRHQVAVLLVHERAELEQLLHDDLPPCEAGEGERGVAVRVHREEVLAPPHQLAA